jgi:hypothetical protein
MLASVHSAAQVIVAMLTIVACVSLVRRKVDPGVRVLFVWGVWIFISGVWAMFTRLAYYSRPIPIVPVWVTITSDFLLLAGPFVTYAVVLYALWRFWRAASTMPKI